MNSLVNRYATNSAEAELRKVRAVQAAEDGEFDDAEWGSAAGYGSLANGAPMFTVPSVADVRVTEQKSERYLWLVLMCLLNYLERVACSLPPPPHRRPCGSKLQNQDRARNDDACFPLSGRCDCCGGLSCYCRQLHWCVCHIDSVYPITVRLYGP
jgi:hypothetical protein